MKKFLALAALAALAACGTKQDGTTTADSVGAGATVPADTMTPETSPDSAMRVDSTMVRDSASH